MTTVIDAKVFADPLQIYYAMLQDIQKAEASVYLETYRFENDPVGIKFRDILTKQAKKGIKVTLLMDAWGTSLTEKFFKPLIDAGGKVRFFKKIRLSLNFISANHERDHRKLLVIDNKVSYISSINISNYNLNWRELSLRIKGGLSQGLLEAILKNYRLRNIYKLDKKRHTRVIRFDEFEIIRDVPSILIQKIKNKYLKLIKQAKKQIIIETPYFLPTKMLREALIDASRRGVSVKVFTPGRSDVAVVNILRQYNMGKLFEAGVEIHFFTPSNLHSKLLIVDDTFCVGSPNFDYRSFRYQFEIILSGKDEKIHELLKVYNLETASESIAFDHDVWKKRKLILKVIERLLLPFRHFL